jgi:prefoldin subunit 5
MDTDVLESRINHIERKLDTLEATIGRLESLLTKFEGAGTLVKLLFFVVTPVLGLFAWAKEHIKF